MLKPMSARIRYGFWIDEAQRDALRAVKARDGILESEQIRRAIGLWLEHKGVTVPKKTARPRVAPRRRAPQKGG